MYTNIWVVHNPGWYCPPGDIWQHLKSFWLSQLRGILPGSTWGYCITSYSAQDNSHNQDLPGPKYQQCWGWENPRVYDMDIRRVNVTELDAHRLSLSLLQDILHSQEAMPSYFPWRQRILRVGKCVAQWNSTSEKVVFGFLRELLSASTAQGLHQHISLPLIIRHMIRDRI